MNGLIVTLLTALAVILALELKDARHALHEIEKRAEEKDETLFLMLAREGLGRTGPLKKGEF